jgi:hypothetical protein
MGSDMNIADHLKIEDAPNYSQHSVTSGNTETAPQTLLAHLAERGTKPLPPAHLQ